MKNDLNKMKMPHWSKLLGWFFVLILVITFFDMVNENGKEAFGLKHTQKTQNSLFCMTTKKTGDPFQLRIPYFIQDTPDDTLGYDKKLPYFVVPISSASSKNIEPLKYALFNLVQQTRK